jgi:hypothetical protein
MPACFSEQGGSHRRGGASAPQTNGDHSNGCYTDASDQGSATTDHGQETSMRHHRGGGRKVRRPRAATARIAFDRARGDKNLSSCPRSQNDQLGVSRLAEIRTEALVVVTEGTLGDGLVRRGPAAGVGYFGRMPPHVVRQGPVARSGLCGGQAERIAGTPFANKFG